MKVTMFLSIFQECFLKEKSKKTSHELTTWNDKVEAILNRSEFDEIIIILDKYKIMNQFVFVLER